MPDGLRVVNNGKGQGIYGESQDSAGVYGVVPSSTGQPIAGPFPGGVVGVSTDGIGVYGHGGEYGVAASGPIGVHARSIQNGTGVFAQVSGAGGTGIHALADGTAILGNGNPGVQAQGSPAVHAQSDSGDAIQAVATSGSGVYGTSASGVGVLGISDTGTAAVVGLSSNSVGVWAIGGGAQPSLVAGVSLFGGPPPGYIVATFVGDVLVQGALHVTGAKSAAVALRDGSHRALYCVESPESWFEDFGRARLVRGKARVRLDRTFAAVVRTGDYHVFLSPEGPAHSLYVSRRTRDGFEVREQLRGTSTVSFSYRIVAHRKDVDAPRFKRLRFPALPKPPRAPKLKAMRVPAPPRSPEPSARRRPRAGRKKPV